MTTHRTLVRREPVPGLPAGRKAAALLALVALRSFLCLQAADVPTELTLSQFLELIRARSTPVKQPAPFPQAEKVFRRLLAAQGQEAAARQSLDRLSGWGKVVQSRFEAQNASALDVEMLRFAEAKAAAELAQLQADRLEALQEANRLLGKTPDTPLVAIAQTPPLTSSAAGEKRQEAPSPQGKTSETSGLSSRPAVLETFQREILPRAQELLSKLYQNYLYNGVSLSTLLWQEQEIYRAELRYWSELAEAEPGGATAAAVP